MITCTICVDQSVSWKARCAFVCFRLLGGLLGRGVRFGVAPGGSVCLEKVATVKPRPSMAMVTRNSLQDQKSTRRIITSMKLNESRRTG